MFLACRLAQHDMTWNVRMVTERLFSQTESTRPSRPGLNAGGLEESRGGGLDDLPAMLASRLASSRTRSGAGFFSSLGLEQVALSSCRRPQSGPADRLRTCAAPGRHQAVPRLPYHATLV